MNNHIPIYRDVLHPREHEAFKELARQLIFNEPSFMILSPDTIPMIAHKLCSEMIALESRSQLKLLKEMDSFIITGPDDFREEFSLKREYDEKTLNHYLSLLDKKDDGGNNVSDYIFLHLFTDQYISRDILDQVHIYDKWGFTPKLSEIPKVGEEYPELAKYAIRKNCVGTTIGLGAYFKRKGLHVELGITSDHPYVIAHLSNGTYCVSNSGVRKISGEFEHKDGYKIYRPTEDDNIGSKIILVHDFDHGIVHEVLENMEVLRLISYGIDATNLPETFASGVELSNRYKAVLRLANWKKIQGKLFPDITRSFDENRIEWEAECLRIKKLREENHPKNVLHMAAEAGLQRTSFFGKDFRESQKTIVKLSVPYRKHIYDFLENNIQFPDTTPKDIVSFYTAARDVIVKERYETQIAVYTIIRLRISMEHHSLTKSKNIQHVQSEKVKSSRHIFALQKIKRHRGKRNTNRRTPSPSLLRG